MRQRKQMPVRSKFRPTESKVESTYDRYVRIQQQLGLTYLEIKRGWSEMCRRAEMSAELGTLIKPINFN